jgi:putative nucleic acid modification protein with dual OB domain
MQSSVSQQSESTLLILAKSYKPGGYCFAGREFILNADGRYTLGKWIRPVSTLIDNKNSISGEICRMNNGNEVGIFDVVRIFFSSEAPEPGQPENIIIDETMAWEWKYKLDYSDIAFHTETPSSLWFDEQSSSEKVSFDGNVESEIGQSLYLIKPTNLVITLSNSYNNNKEKFHKEIHASFQYNGAKYENLSITDPKIRRMLSHQYPPDGQPDISMPLKKGDDYILCLSLGPRFGPAQEHWKFVATIYDFDGYIQRTY